MVAENLSCSILIYLARLYCSSSNCSNLPHTCLNYLSSSAVVKRGQALRLLLFFLWWALLSWHKYRHLLYLRLHLILATYLELEGRICHKPDVRTWARIFSYSWGICLLSASASTVQTMCRLQCTVGSCIGICYKNPLMLMKYFLSALRHLIRSSQLAIGFRRVAVIIEGASFS